MSEQERERIRRLRNIAIKDHVALLMNENTQLRICVATIRKALALAAGDNRIADGDGQALVRIRHRTHGLYLEMWCNRSSTAAFGGYWQPQAASATVFTRDDARQASAFYIALTDDHDVELDPVAEDEA